MINLGNDVIIAYLKLKGIKTTTEYLTATQAKQLVEDANSLQGESFKQETLDVLGIIKTEAAKAKTCLVQTGKIQDVIAKRLRALGYSVVTNSDQREGAWTTISW